ncbi:hypothetical protein UT300005_16600 [Clostridium sp. CTA-5]
MLLFVSDESESFFDLSVDEYDPLLNPFEAPLLELVVFSFVLEEFLALSFVLEKLPDLNPSALLLLVFFSVLEEFLVLSVVVEEFLVVSFVLEKFPDLNPSALLSLVFFWVEVVLLVELEEVEPEELLKPPDLKPLELDLEEELLLPLLLVLANRLFVDVCIKVLLA